MELACVLELKTAFSDTLFGEVVGFLLDLLRVKQRNLDNMVSRGYANRSNHKQSKYSGVGR